MMIKNLALKNSLLKSNLNPEIISGDLKPSIGYKLQKVRDLTESTYIMRIDRNGMKFTAGQHITLGVPGDNQMREYSIYSTENDPFIEVLIKEVNEGLVSKKLHFCSPGNLLNVDGPLGFFTIEEEMLDRPYLFIASGTGIAPFHSIAGTYPNLNYTLLHGVRYGNEAYERHDYPAGRYVLCTSRDDTGHFHGRVTDYVVKNQVDSGTIVYLCGNCDMIYNVYDILMRQRFPVDQIKTEVYF